MTPSTCQRGTLRIVAWCVIVALAMLGRPARAGDQPWAVGVTDAQKAEAQKHLDDGNALFLKRDYKEALAAYREAIESWDHPAIRFNVVRCLIQLDQPVEAAENLEAALKYGSAPLEEGVYAEALSYQKLFAKQIGDLAVSCTQAGAKVTLDGQPLIDHCPGKQARRVKPGAHQIVGIAHGFLTQTLDTKVVGGEHDAVEVKLVPLAKAAKVTRRWSAWKPWVVFGGGLTLLAVGGSLQAIASSTMSSYDQNVTRGCAGTGCNDPNDPTGPQLSDQLKRTAQTENHVALGLMSAGAVATLAGGVLLYLNRVHTVYPSGIEHVDVAPAPGGATVTVSGSF